MAADVKVVLSFATEDFVTPEHDDILLFLAEGLTKRGLIGNFHLTGQLARTLRQRGRTDVIDAIAKHELGYHSNTHGMSPFIAQVFEENSWDEGLAKVLPGEAKGLRDVEEIIGKRAEYFVLEFVKAPQLVHGMALLGVRQVGISNIPTFGRAAVWMAGSLCYGYGQLLGLEAGPDTPDRLGRMRRKFDELYAQAKEGVNDGIVRPFLHPYKLNTVPRKSWGLINHAYERDLLPDGEWQIPERLPTGVVRRLMDEHDAILDHMAGTPDVRFAPMTVLREIYAVDPPKTVDIGTVVALAQEVQDRPRAIVYGGWSYSPAEVYALLMAALAHYAKAGSLAARVPYRLVIGPVEESSGTEECQVDAERFLQACALEERRVDFHGRMSPGLESDGCRIGPGAALAAAARFVIHAAESSAPKTVAIESRPDLPEIAADPYFQEDTFHRPGIYPDGFTGANICRFCRLQSWSVKPALLR